MSKSLRATDSRAILVELMEVERGGAGYLSPADLASVLEHQLRTPLALESEELLLVTNGTGEARAVEEGADRTFAEVVRASAAGDPLLRVVKDYAKRQLTLDGGLPEPVARFVYVAAALRARTVGDTTVSTLDDASLEAEARRLLTAHWLPGEAREIVRSGLTD